jgi:hypothetical protein
MPDAARRRHRIGRQRSTSVVRCQPMRERSGGLQGPSVRSEKGSHAPR